ncbi:enoyl-CoA hydratase/isomerase family protein [bacterium]|nr:enoyl-CoA hydratase/isomerase family protein [bacterium]
MREEWFNLSFSIEDCIGIITLSDNSGDNLISIKMLRELKNGLKVFHHSKEVKVILIRGNQTCFSKGLDPNEIENHSNLEVADYIEFGWKVFNKLSEIRKPIICEVSGDAFDGGFEITLLADLVYASPQARFGFPGIKQFNSPVYGGITNLIDIAGIRFTKELLFRGNIINADLALDKGIINQVFSADEISKQVLTICKEIAVMEPPVIAYMKENAGKVIDLLRRLRVPDELNAFTITRSLSKKI